MNLSHCETFTTYENETGFLCTGHYVEKTYDTIYTTHRYTTS